MKSSTMSWGALTLLLAGLVGCGGDDSSGPTVPPSGGPTAQIIAAAAADPANDTSINSSASFAVMQSTTVPAVIVNSPPVVNFTVFSDGKVLQGLKLRSPRDCAAPELCPGARFAIAKLTPGTNGEPDRWESYVSTKVQGKAGYGPGGSPVLSEALQATTDNNDDEMRLVYNADGYYTYTFATDIKDSDQTNGVDFEPGKTHRIAIQLQYNNSAGETVRVNPYFDFTIGPDGKSITVTDPNATRVMADVNSCNGCHEKLALHGGGRVDVQYCVMCHNPGTTDPESGNVLTMSTMVHKIHAGRGLATAVGGEHYSIWGFGNSKHDYSEVGFPQDLRNCAVCHSSDPTKTKSPTPQGDNWKSQVSKEACLTCHASNAGSTWDDGHILYAQRFHGPSATAQSLTNADCFRCHTQGTNFGSDTVHWNQNEENAVKYKMVIESASYDAAARKVTVKYYLADPTNGDVAYNLVTPDCTYTGTAGICVPPGNRPTINAKFGNLRLYLAYQNMLADQFPTVTEFTSYNNGGSGANAYAHMGVNDGNNHYTIDIALPADSDYAVAGGTARVVSIGQIKEKKLRATSAAVPRPEVVPTELVNTLAQNTFMDVVLSGSLQARRDVVSNEKCNVCHGALGSTSGSNTADTAFHSGARNTVESCALCHDANRASSTVMTNGIAWNESYQFKRMIHGIHGNSKRLYPFTHGNSVVGAFCNPSNPASVAPLCDPSLTLASNVENYAAEVAWPGVGINCNACHVNNSYQTDSGTLGAVILKGPTFGAPADPNPNNWKVISPKAASCTACHDSSAAIGHVTSFGGSSFGNASQGEIAALQRETCNDCHSPGGFKGVDIVHGLK